MNEITRQLAKAITKSPAQTQLKPPAALSLTRGEIAGVNVIIANVPTTTVKLAGSSIAVPAEVSIGYGVKIGDVVDILVAPPRLVVLGPTSSLGGLGDFPDYEGQGDPNGQGLRASRGQWYKDESNGTLWLNSGSDDDWTHMNPGVITGGAEYGLVEIDIGYTNAITGSGFSNLIMMMGWGNTVNSGVSAYVFGAGNTVTGEGMAIGGGNTVDGFRSVAIGYAASATNPSQVALGGFGHDYLTIFGGNFSFFYNGGSDPTGSVVSDHAGDLCQTGTGGLFISAVGGSDSDWSLVSGGGGGGGGTVDSVVAGVGISVDDTDPANPVVSAAGLLITTTSFTADSYTLAFGDGNTFQLASNGATPGTIVIPLNADVPFAVGTVISVLQTGSGAISITATGGVTVVSSVSGGFVSGTTGCRVQDSTIGLVQVALDAWALTGDAA